MSYILLADVYLRENMLLRKTGALDACVGSLHRDAVASSRGIILLPSSLVVCIDQSYTIYQSSDFSCSRSFSFEEKIIDSTPLLQKDFALLPLQIPKKLRSCLGWQLNSGSDVQTREDKPQLGRPPLCLVLVKKWLLLFKTRDFLGRSSNFFFAKANC